MYIVYETKPILEAVTFDAAVNSEAILVAGFTRLGVILKWTGLTGTINGTYAIQVSNNKDDWDTLTSPIAFSGADGLDAIAVNDCNYAFFRLVCAVGGITGGTLDASVCMK